VTIREYLLIVAELESQNQNLAQNLRQVAEVCIFACSRGKQWPVVFLPLTFDQALLGTVRVDR
jgi:hypothetical protein